MLAKKMRRDLGHLGPSLTGDTRRGRGRRLQSLPRLAPAATACQAAQTLAETGADARRVPDGVLGLLGLGGGVAADGEVVVGERLGLVAGFVAGHEVLLQTGRAALHGHRRGGDGAVV